MQTIYFYQTSIGNLGIVADENAITRLYFDGETQAGAYPLLQTQLLQAAGEELQAYLAGRLKHFTLPLAPVGAAYMQRAWSALRAIPYGETRSYQGIAASLGNPLAARAVGLANNKNPIPIFIPCHRVIGKNGKLVGFRGGLAVKEHLLALERQHAHI
jgi:methylated-DNA-[protein]-cysteine S-methyltransferase